MKDKRAIMTEIIRLTNNIETNYPELCRFLDENPVTIPIYQHPAVDVTILEVYLDDLKTLSKHHLQIHKTKML